MNQSMFTPSKPTLKNQATTSSAKQTRKMQRHIENLLSVMIEPLKSIVTDPVVKKQLEDLHCIPDVPENFRSNKQGYIGQYRNFQKCGLGYQKDPDGREYLGYWLDDHPHGAGTMIWGKEKWFVGQIEKGQMHGLGILKDDQGTYSGQFEADKRHGHGLQTYKDESSYAGNWHQGERNGSGCEKLPDGTSFIGTYVKGVRHGQGALRSVDGEYKSGTWDNGEMVPPTPRKPLRERRFPRPVKLQVTNEN